MIKKITAACCLLAIVCALCGCRLAKEGSGADAKDDRMIGVLMTTGDNQKYNGRIYATESEIPEGEAVGPADYTFEGVDGLRYFMVSWSPTESTRPYHANIFDPGISHGHTSINITDDGESLALEGTIFVTPAEGGRNFYFNPVYQDLSGSVYVTSGSGFGSTGESGIGASFSQTMASSTTVTENGKQTTDEMSVTISVSVMRAPEKLVLLQMGEDNTVISRDEYAPGAAPESMTLKSGTAYIISESFGTDADGKTHVTRTLYNNDAEYVRSYHDRGDGILELQDTKIDWQ